MQILNFGGGVIVGYVIGIVTAVLGFFAGAYLKRRNEELNSEEDWYG